MRMRSQLAEVIDELFQRGPRGGGGGEYALPPFVSSDAADGRGG